MKVDKDKLKKATLMTAIGFCCVGIYGMFCWLVLDLLGSIGYLFVFGTLLFVIIVVFVYKNMEKTDG